MEALAAREVVIPPSGFLGWLKDAREAHARCQALLPLLWTVELKYSKKEVLVCKGWLQRQQQQHGDRWGNLHLDSKAQAQLDVLCEPDADLGVSIRCSGCGKLHPHVQLCSGCKQARYCRYAAGYDCMPIACHGVRGLCMHIECCTDTRWLHMTVKVRLMPVRMLCLLTCRMPGQWSLPGLNLF